MMRWALRAADDLRHRARLRRWNRDEAAGRRGEDLAHRYLERQGFLVVARNYRPPGGAGEIDLVAWDGEDLVFVEVKSRHSGEYGAPERNIGEDKIIAMTRTAHAYARRADVPYDRIRFDVVGILLGPPPEIQHFKDAFSGTRRL